LNPLFKLIFPIVPGEEPETVTLIFDDAMFLTIYPFPAASVVSVPSLRLKKLPAAALYKYISSIDAFRALKPDGVSVTAEVKLIKLNPGFRVKVSARAPDDKTSTKTVAIIILLSILPPLFYIWLFL